MMAPFLASLALFLGGLGFATAIIWRRNARSDTPVERKIEGTCCYPKVQR